MQLPYSEQLNIAALSRLFDNKSECYKLFWFQAILGKICAGESDILYEDLIDEMIADAWYMVTEYHLNLGPRDTLEKAVNHIHGSTGMLPSAKKQDVLNWLKQCTDPEVLKYKRDLTLNVPYRLQAPFFEEFRTDSWNCGTRELAMRINQQKRLMHYFDAITGLQTKIHIDPDWAVYIKENQEILRGWIQYNLILYLQRRNPSVPGISDKLNPPQERKLEKVKKFWKVLSELDVFHEIYDGIEITKNNISIDHFVPWSYVAHDEFWNLHPTTRSINSSKSNNLPEWQHYFPLLADLEYHSYQMIWTYDTVRKEFEKCAKEHLNNPEIAYRLYRRQKGDDSPWIIVQVVDASRVPGNIVHTEDQPPIDRKNRYFYAIEAVSTAHIVSDLSYPVGVRHNGPDLIDVPLTLSATYDSKAGQLTLDWQTTAEAPEGYWCYVEIDRGNGQFEPLASFEPDQKPVRIGRLKGVSPGMSVNVRAQLRWFDDRFSPLSNVVRVNVTEEKQ